MTLFHVRDLSRKIIMGSLLPLLVFLTWSPVLSSPVASEDVRVQKEVHWHMDGNIAVITYQLVGPSTEKVEITVVLKRKNLPSFSYSPKTLTGDVGDDIVVGGMKTIRWDYLKDFPNGLQGEDFYFVVSAGSGGGGGWLYYVLGGIAVGGGAAAYAIFGHHPGSTPAATTVQFLPPPPQRPG